MIATNDEILDQLTKQFEELQSNLDCYLNPSEGLHGELVSSSKTLYDLMKSNETVTGQLKKSSAPQKLLTKGFDNEQIWQQLQLHNAQQLRNAKHSFLNIDNSNVTLVNFESKKNIEDLSEYDSDEGKEGEDIESDLISDEDDEIEADSDEEESKFVEKKYKATVVDDDFFKLRQMEDFLNEQDKLEESKQDTKDDNEDVDSDDEDLEEDIDLFDEESEGNVDESSNRFMYKDFFDPIAEGALKKKKKKAEILEEDFEDIDENEMQIQEDNKVEKSESESESESEDEAKETIEESGKKSAFERKQEELKQKISKLEEANISAKPWQLIGEATSKARPMNSLLEEHMAFDHTSVGAPVITEETTESIEDIIKQRVRDQAWDDVERKVKPTTQPHEYKKAPELNMEKSKLSLAEVYEKEYLKQAEDNKEEKEDENHVLIKGLMDKLFVKLDALSNFYFTPKPAKPEIKVITNTPSLQMEEVTPVTMSHTSQMAPEEIYEKKKGDVVGDGEKTEEDRKRERRQKKIKKKFAVKERELKEALKAKTGGIATKKKALEQLKKGVRNTIINEKQNAETAKATKSSNQFFNKLQDEVTKKISSQKSVNSDGQSKKKKQKTENFKL